MTTEHDEYFLILDQGGHSSRAMVINQQGQVITENKQPVKVSRNRNKQVEYDAEEVIQSLQQAIAKAIQPLDPDRPLQTVGLATQRSNIVCWDRVSGEPLSPILSWQDRRAQSRLSQVSAAAKSIHQHTGLHLSPYYGASKLNWCLTEIPAVSAALKQQRLALGPMASFIAHRLLTERPLLVDAVNASRTLLWDLLSHDWSDELLNLFSIPRSALPQCVTNQAHFGSLTIAKQQLPMTIITGDQSAALLAWGAPQSNSAYITVGTGAFIQCYTGQQAVLSKQLLTSLVHLDDDGPLYCLEGTVNGAGSALSWACNEFGLDNVDENLSDWLDQSQQPPLFLNGISGLGTPYLGRHLDSRYIGQGSQQEYIVAVIESIVFLIKRNLETMLNQVGSVGKIYLGGGLSRLNGFCQRLADLSQIMVIKSEHHETTSIGMAYLLAGKPKQWSMSESTQQFTPTSNIELLHRYQKWQRALEDSLQR